MKLNTGPDMRYGAEFTSGKTIVGSRKKVLIEAIEAAKKGVFVVAWDVPGMTELIKKQRREALDQEYRAEIGQ